MEAVVGCLVMAAGNASRFESNKLAAEFEGKTLVERALCAVPPGLKTVVVTQYPQVLQLAERFGFASLKNEHPDWGISHTIKLGTAYLQHCDAIVYMVSDQPLLQQSSVCALIDEWKRHPQCIVGLSHNGKRGNPCIFPCKFYAELMQLREDNGGNTVIRCHLDALHLVEAAQSELTDVDTKKALQELKKQQEE